MSNVQVQSFDKFDQVSHGSWFGLVNHKPTFHTRRLWKTTQLCEYVIHCNHLVCSRATEFNLKIVPFVWQVWAVLKWPQSIKVHTCMKSGWSYEKIPRPYTLFNIRWPKHFLIIQIKDSWSWCFTHTNVLNAL